MGMFDNVLNKVGEKHSSSKGFKYGTHEVIIGEVTPKAKDTQKAKNCEIIEVIVFDEQDNDKKATCTLWFHTEGAAQMSVTKVLGLLVHKVSEDKKDAVRELGKKLFGGVDDLTKARDIAAKLMGDKLIGAKGYLVAEPNGKYTTTSYGDLWHYEEKPKGEKEITVESLGGEDVTDEIEIPEDL